MPDKPMEGMGDCMACPHCGKPVYLSSGKSSPDEPMPESEESFEDGLRKEMSPRSETETEAY